jgi:hypothetical protein
MSRSTSSPRTSVGIIGTTFNSARSADRLAAFGMESGYDGSIELGLATDVGAELILIEAALEFEPVGVWTGD